MGAGTRDGDLRRLFPKTAPVVSAAAGLNRLPIPPEVLRVCRPDLSDLRVVTAAGVELPFAVVAEPSPEGARRPVARRPATVEAVRRHEERPPSGPAIFHESYTLRVPDLPRGAARWELELSTGMPSFVCRLDLSVPGPGGSWAAVLRDGAAFRLGNPVAEKLRFPVPLQKAGILRVELTGENGAYLEPRFTLSAFRSPPVTPPLAIPMAQLSISHGPGQTVLRLARPAGVVPSKLRLETSSPAFLRTVTVWDEQTDGTIRRVASTKVFRLKVASTAVERLEIPLGRLFGRQLRIEIEDGDSPPLERLSVTALLPRPILVTSLPAGQATALYFGGGRARAPRYDLDRLLRLPSRGLTDRLNAIPAASLGPVSSNPAFDPSPVLAFLMHPGAPLDPAPYGRRRRLAVEPSREGLSALPLQPEDLSVLRPDLADLRIVDADHRQWAFVLAGRTATAFVRVASRREEGKGAASRYILELPASPLPLSGLEVDFAAAFFDRPYQVRARTAKKGSIAVRSGRLKRRRGRSSPIRIFFRPVRATELVLEVENGGDAPLDMVSSRIQVPRPVLLLPAPKGSYTLLLDNPIATWPRYEVEAIRATVLAIPSKAIDSGPLEPNPELRSRARLLAGGNRAQLLLWVALALAVLVLVWLTLRLARQAPPE